MLFIRLIKESFLFATNAILVNKLRTILSLLGITIGIFAIISVFTVVDSLEKNIKNSIEKLGDNVLFVQKWPWVFDDPDFPWWKYLSRHPASFKNYKDLKNRLSLAEAVTFMATQYSNVTYLNNTAENVAVVAVGPDYSSAMYVDISEGRYFSSQEEAAGKNVAIIGYDIANSLFNGTEALSKTIKINGIKMNIIGVFAKEGENNFGNSADDQIMIPASFASNFMRINFDETDPTIIVKAKNNVSTDELKDELTGAMRAVRKLKPFAENDFSINETSMLTMGFEEFFGILNIAGWLIGIFSLLVGGFGIANIMFVSVKERTNIIGIQKSLGAKPYFILLEFLFEAVFLCLIGGSVGLALVYIIAYVSSGSIGMELSLSLNNIIMGFTVSFVIGIISGFIPAWNAAKLDPVEAIRSNT